MGIAKHFLNCAGFTALSLAASQSIAAPFISEIHYDNSGTDTGEAIEITAETNIDLNGWSVVLYNGSSSSVYNTRTLSGSTTASESCDSGVGTLVLDYPTNGIQNGSRDGIALVNADGDVVEFLSYEGTLTAASGPATGMTSSNIGVSESSSTSIGFSLQLESGTWNSPAQNSFGSCNRGSGSGGTGGSSSEVTRIHEIQGSGNSITSEQVVTVEAIVTADYQNSDQLRGFFIQEEDSDIDSNNATSEGIFVFCSSCPTDVSVGDQVRVTGLANEFFGMSQITASFDTDIEVLASDVSLPTPASVSLPVATTASDLATATDEINAFYEAYEGMLISVPETLSVAEYFQLGRFGQVVLSAGGRPHQFTDMHLPDAQGFIDHQIDVASRRLILDDDNNSQNAALFNDTPVFFPDGGFSVDNYFRGGDTINALTGVLHWSWAGFSGTNAWRVRPVPEAFEYTFEAANLRTEAPSDVGGSLKVASFNVLNYFTTLDQGPSVCGPDATLGCRGANSAEELERQTQKIVSAICAIDADIVGLMELENPNRDAAVTPIAALVSAINASCPEYQAIETGPVGNDAITVGVIYKPESVFPVGTSAILDDVEFTDPNATGRDRNRPVVAQSFKEFISERTITVAVNHLKSKGSSCGEGDDDTTTGQGNCNHTRTLAAQYQAEWLGNNPTQVYNNDYVLVMGDLNAYRNEDPIRAFTGAGYTDLLDFFDGADAYGYVFNGQLGYLDHALANEKLFPLITGTTEWHINSDEVNLLDYNDAVRDSGEASFEAKPSALPLFADDAYRSSDHDPLVIGIEFPSIELCHGREPTIYVEDGIIVGGPDDGQVYNRQLRGTDGNDVILGTSRSENIVSGPGEDIICAGAGGDIIASGPGHDVISGGEGDDNIAAGADHDVIYGGPGRDLVYGGTGNDTCEAEFTQDCE